MSEPSLSAALHASAEAYTPDGQPPLAQLLRRHRTRRRRRSAVAGLAALLAAGAAVPVVQAVRPSAPVDTVVPASTPSASASRDPGAVQVPQVGAPPLTLNEVQARLFACYRRNGSNAEQYADGSAGYGPGPGQSDAQFERIRTACAVEVKVPPELTRQEERDTRAQAGALRDALRARLQQLLPTGTTEDLDEPGGVNVATPTGVSRNLAGRLVWRDDRGATRFSIITTSIAYDRNWASRCEEAGADCVELDVGGQSVRVQTPSPSRNSPDAPARQAWFTLPDGSAAYVEQKDGTIELVSPTGRPDLRSVAERGWLPLTDQQLAELTVGLAGR